MHDDESERTNPSGSYALFRDEARRVAGLLDRVAFVERKRIDLYDAARLAANADLSRQLRELAERIDRWPKLDAPTAATERAQVVPLLFRVLREALTLLEQTPAMGALGRVPKP